MSIQHPGKFTWDSGQIQWIDLSAEQPDRMVAEAAGSEIEDDDDAHDDLVDVPDPEPATEARYNIKDYWIHGEGRAKWVGKPHPWTALYHHLVKHMPPEQAKRTAAQWHKDVFGIWPGEKKGKNPLGPG